MSRALLLAVLSFIGIALFGQRLLAQAPYDLPNDNNGCPANCRQIPWQAGSDLWNGGSLPNYTSVTCTGLAGDGTTDDGPAMQTCINKANAGTAPYNTCVGACAVFIPAGTYLVNSRVRLKSNVVLRGAGTGTSGTFINEGASGGLDTQSFSGGSFLDPPTTYATNRPGYVLSGTPTKGTTTLTVSTQPSGGLHVGDWIAVFADDDPTLVTATGTDGLCQWCADNTGHHLMQQIVQITNISGSTLTISRPLYYTLYTNPAYRRYSFQTQRAGFENFKVTATGDIGANSIIMLEGCLECWVNNVETQNTGSSSGSAHIHFQYSYGGEVRNSYWHDGRSSASGANYGVYFEFVNSDHKIENNIMRHNRHSIVFQGGGSGIAILYNYVDDDYTDDLSYLGSARLSHGAHPFMNLLEGNVISHIAADDFWGSSSHFVFLRNWLWGDESWIGVPSYTGGGGPRPIEGFDAIDLYTMQTYYSFVGNVLGRTGMHTTWSAATLRGFDEYAPTTPIVYSFGTASGGIPSADTTSINHGNYDYKTNGVAYWEGGSNHTLRTSMYYASQPSFLNSYAWPIVGPDVNSGVPSTTAANPAMSCFFSVMGGKDSTGNPSTFNPTTCYAAAGNGGGDQAPAPPTSLKATVQ